MNWSLKIMLVKSDVQCSLSLQWIKFPHPVGYCNDKFYPSDLSNITISKAIHECLCFSVKANLKILPISRGQAIFEVFKTIAKKILFSFSVNLPFLVSWLKSSQISVGGQKANNCIFPNSQHLLQDGCSQLSRLYFLILNIEQYYSRAYWPNSKDKLALLKLYKTSEIVCLRQIVHGIIF